MKTFTVLFLLFLSTTAFAQRGAALKFDLSPLDTIVAAAVDTTLIDVSSGYGDICGPITVYFEGTKLSDSIMLTVVYDITADPNLFGWYTLTDTTKIASDIAGAGEVKQILDTLLTTAVGWTQMRVRVIGGADNDKTAGSSFAVVGVAQRCISRR